MSRYIAAYDIADDRRRIAAAKILLRYGERIQKSVFEVWLDPDELPEARRLIGPILDDSDSFELIPIDLSPQRDRWRWAAPLEEYAPVHVLGR